jgi:hypothetical protein
MQRLVHAGVVANCKTNMKRNILIFAFLFTHVLAFSQNEEGIYSRVFIDYIEKLKQPKIDYSSGITLTVLKRPEYIEKLDTNDYYRFRDKYDKLEMKTFINFIKDNQTDLHFEKIDIHGTNVVILENESIPSWLELSSKYPNWIYSIIELSNIGFNEARNQALVYYSFNSGPGVGGGFYLVLENNGRKWKCKKVIPAWAA